MRASTFGYGKEEKLKSRKLIEQLFAEGRSINAAPLRLVYIQPAAVLDFPVKMGVGASTRNFKKAVDRNRVKRLLREAYRLNKRSLLDHASATGQQLVAFILYTGKTLPDFETVNTKMQILLKKLITATSETTPENT
jgi:ribonuclease P protein component